MFLFLGFIKRWISLRRVDVRDEHLVKRGIVLHESCHVTRLTLTE
jgi:hypothetical protein